MNFVFPLDVPLDPSNEILYYNNQIHKYYLFLNYHHNHSQLCITINP